MKKTLILLIAGAMMVMSCEKKDKEEISESGEPKEISKLAPEVHKTDIQSSAIDLVEEMNTLVKTEAAEAVVQIVTLMENSESLKSAKASPANVLYGISDLSAGESNITEFLTGYSAMEEGDDDIQSMYDEMKGTYTYNPVTEEFDETPGTQLVIKFPSTEGGTTNDATFEVIEFKTGTYTSDMVEEMGGVLPESIKAQLTIGSSVVMEFNTSASYKADGTPTSLSSSLTLSGFTFSTTLSNKDDKDVSWEASFKNGDTKIISCKAGLKGSISEQNIQDNTHYIVETYDMDLQKYVEKEVTKEVYDATEEDYNVYKWEEVDIENVLNSSYAYMDIFNIRAGGDVNIKEMVPVMNEIDDEWDLAYEEHWQSSDEPFNDKPYEEKYAAAMNEYMNFYVAYIEEKQKIANIEFYVAEDQDSIFDYDYTYMYDEFGNMVFDENGFPIWVETKEFDHMETYYYTDGRLIFGDDSKIDAETYLEDGFKSFFDKVNELITTLNTEYDADLDPVDYEEVFE